MNLLLQVIISKLIDKYGEEAQLYKRTVKTVDGRQVFDYSKTPILIKGQFLQIMPYDYAYTEYGSVPLADFIATFKPDTDISEGDKIVLYNDVLEVQNVIPRKHAGKIVYLEVLLRKRA